MCSPPASDTMVASCGGGGSQVAAAALVGIDRPEERRIRVVSGMHA
jgi:hypothetical protein